MDALLKQLEPRVARMLMAAVLLLSAAALGSYAIWPLLKEARETASTLTLLERVNRQGRAIDQEILAAEQRVVGLERQLHGDMADKTDHELEAFVLGRMQGISWRNNVELQSVKPAKGGKVLDFEEVKFEVRVSGQYFDLYSWIQDLNAELGFVVVKKFHLRAAPGDAIEPQLTATFTVVSYRGLAHA